MYRVSFIMTFKDKSVINVSQTSFFCLSLFVSDSLPSSVLLIFLFLFLS